LLTRLRCAAAACFFADVVLLLLFEIRRMLLLLHFLWVTHVKPRPAVGPSGPGPSSATRS
jgi:hypothetical protein